MTRPIEKLVGDLFGIDFSTAVAPIKGIRIDDVKNGLVELTCRPFFLFLFSHSKDEETACIGYKTRASCSTIAAFVLKWHHGCCNDWSFGYRSVIDMGSRWVI